MAHSRFSPSKMERVIQCPGSLALEETVEDTKTSIYAAEGTAAHELASWVLTDGVGDAREYIGEVIEVLEQEGTPNEQRFEFQVDEEMSKHIQTYADNVKSNIEYYKTLGDVESIELKVEQQINTSDVLGVPDQFGTADVVILVNFKDKTTFLSVEDLKYGRGVAVQAENNKQLMTYGAGVFHEYALTHDIKAINLVIHQPRLNSVSSDSIKPEEMENFISELKEGVTRALAEGEKLKKTKDASTLNLSPSGKACKFCKYKGQCPAVSKLFVERICDPEPIESFEDISNVDITAKIEESIDRIEKGFVDKDKLSEFMQNIELFEDWIKAVRTRVSNLLHDGEDIKGFKLIEGRKGAQKWKDQDEAKKIMRSMRVPTDVMYTKKLISPTQAAKIIKTPRKWSRLKDLISQPDGKPTVAPESHKKPKLVLNSAKDFDNIEEEALCD